MFNFYFLHRCWWVASVYVDEEGMNRTSTAVGSQNAFFFFSFYFYIFNIDDAGDIIDDHFPSLLFHI